jgi:hypothetical protein
MRKPKELPQGALERLAMALKQAKTKAEFQSVQCLWLRASLARFIHEGMRKPLPMQFFEVEKSTSWAERRWKKPRSDISGQ